MGEPAWSYFANVCWRLHNPDHAICARTRKLGHGICESPLINGRTTLKVSRFSDEPVIHLLQQAERGKQPIGMLCREHGISEQTFDRWRKQFGGMTIPDTQR
jgi:Transposase